jgi:hypothetical protein
MAQAKTRSRGVGARTKSSNGNKSSASSSRARSSRSRSNSAKSRSNSSSKRTASKSRSRSRSPQAKSAQPKGFLDKAKTPLVAGGAALVGVAGGAIAARSSSKRRSFPKLPTPNLKKLPSPKSMMPNGDALDWVESKAKTLGDAGYRVAALSSDAQKVKKGLKK